MKRIFSAILCAVLLLALVPALLQTASAASITHFNIRLDEPVASYTPDFSADFNTDVYLYTSVTWKENSPGFNAKLNSNDEFRAGLAYKVDIWVRFSDGNSLATDSYGDLAAAITVNGKAISSLIINDRNDQNQINEVIITCEYDPLAGREISSVIVTGVPTPVAGNMPIYSFTIESSSYGFYPTEPVVWRDKTDNYKQLDSSDTFIEGHEYQLCIWLSANREGGFTFKTDQNGNPQVNATINSWAPDKVNKAYEQDGREVIELLYTFPACKAVHTCAPKLVPMQKQTCVMPGFKAYYECSCGKCYEDAAGKKLITDLDGYGIIPADGHKEGKWSYNGTHHYKKCTTCLSVIPGTNAAHTPGPAATESNPQVCTGCGYIIAPAKNHTHNLTKVAKKDATCVTPGNVEYYTCDGCSDLFADSEAKTKITDTDLAPLGHKLSDDWKHDESTHWRTCTNCAEALPETQMNHDIIDGKCSTCGYTVGDESISTGSTPVESTPVESTPAESTYVQPDNQDEEPSNFLVWIIAIVVGIICFGAGIGIALLIIKKKKQ